MRNLEWLDFRQFSLHLSDAGGGGGKEVLRREVGGGEFGDDPSAIEH
jgi:hypothetical protein